MVIVLADSSVDAAQRHEELDSPMARQRSLTCPECGQSFAQVHHRQSFCTPAHKVAFNNRLTGRSVAQLAQAWRAARSSKDPAMRQAGNMAFKMLCQKTDMFNEEDRNAGRLHPTRVFMQRERDGLLDQGFDERLARTAVRRTGH
jgi:hypothetical protein